METEKIIDTTTDTSNVTDQPTDKVDEVEVHEMITLTKIDFDKTIQSETDKVRTEYSKKVRTLEETIKNLSPIEKTQAELDMEKRLADLEARQIEIDKREQFLKLQENLASKNLDKTLSNFLSPDTDIDELAKVFEGMYNERLKSKGFQPNNHVPNETITKEQWQKMDYSERQDLYIKNPDLYRKFTNKA